MQNLVYALLIVPILLIIAVAIFGGFASNINQAGWSTSANNTFTSINTNTWNGFSLGALLPFVLIAVVLIGVILGALGGLKA